MEGDNSRVLEKNWAHVSAVEIVIYLKEFYIVKISEFAWAEKACVMCNTLWIGVIFPDKTFNIEIMF